MANVSLVGSDVAGGVIVGGGQTAVKTDGAAWAVVGDAVASHGDSPHNAATMAGGSSFVTVNGLAVVRAGDAATCGHTASGSPGVDVSA